jgi:hypothetical protein
MSTDEEYKQFQIDTLRANLDKLQANIEPLSRYIDKNTIRKQISEWRLCVTTVRKHYPKPPALFEEMSRFKIDDLLAMMVTHAETHQDLRDYIQRLRDLLEYPQTYFDNYDDMFPPVDREGKRMLSEIGYRDFLLKELHDKQDPTILQMVGVSEQSFIDMESKQFKKQYKKYVEEWKKTND